MHAPPVNDRPIETRGQRTAFHLLGFVALSGLYFVTAKLGLTLAFVHASASAVWPATGLALAAGLLVGPRVWPAVFAGAFLANLTTAGTVPTSLGIATGNTLEGVIGTYLVDRLARGRHTFDRAAGVFAFGVLAGLASTAVSATFGVTSLAVGGIAPWADYGSIWLTWWLGDAAGALVVTPVVLLWASPRPAPWSVLRVLEGAALLVCLVVAGQIVFGGLVPGVTDEYHLESLCMPFLLWGAFRFGAREAATATLLLSGIAISGTLHGSGPFARHSPNDALLLLQSFMGVASLMTLVVAALVAERRQVERRLRALSASDPLTGLANYRHLMVALQSEVRRAERTQRPFAVVMLDVDDLKQVNDRLGHIAGNRALCRVAEALRDRCRIVDTAARFGGDEFAVILHEADEAAAAQVVQRICERLRSDAEAPPLSVSLGVAVYPRDGQDVGALIESADRTLYAMRARRHAAAPQRSP